MVDARLGARAVWIFVPILVVVPLARGGMGRTGEVVRYTCVAVFLAATVWQHRPLALRLAGRPFGPPALLLGGLMVLQLLPMPAAVLGQLSPGMLEAAELARRTCFYPEVALAELGWGEGTGGLRVPAADAERWSREPGPAQEKPRSFASLALDQHRAGRSWLALLAWMAVAWGATAWCRRRAVRARVRLVVGCGAVILAALGIATKFPVVRSAIFPPIYRFEGPVGTFVNRDHFAGYCLVTLPVFGVMLHRGMRRVVASRAELQRKTVDLIVTGFGGTLVLVAGLLANSRAGSVLLLAEAAVLSALLVASMRGGRRVQAGTLAALVMLALAVASMERGRFLTRLQGLGTGLSSDESYTMRIQMFRAAAVAVGRFPLFGTGLGCAGPALEVMGLQPKSLVFEHVHNEYLQWLVETGLVGAIVAVGALLLVGRVLVRARWDRAVTWMKLLPMMALAAHSMVDFPARTAAVAYSLAAMVGMFLGEVLEPREEPPTEASLAWRHPGEPRAAGSRAKAGRRNRGRAPFGGPSSLTRGCA